MDRRLFVDTQQQTEIQIGGGGQHGGNGIQQIIFLRFVACVLIY